MGRGTLAVIVTYNRRDLLRKSVRHVLAQDAHCDVLVVDNASTDGTAEMVSSEFGCEPRLTHFDTGANLGGAGGFHLGMYWAVISDYDYAWVMDDDSLPEPTALSELLGAGSRLGDWGFLSSAVYWTDGAPCLANRPKRDLFRHLGPSDYGSAEPIPIMMGSFVSMLVPTEVIREVGLPLAEYFIWTDDYEFSGRISKGRQGWFVPASKVTHAMAANTRADLVTADGERASRFRMLYRNDVHCYRQHGLAGGAYLAAKGAYTAADVVIHAKDRRGERLRSMVAGYLEGMRFGPRAVRVGRRRVAIYIEAWSHGGIESFLMNVLRDPSMREFDVTLFVDWTLGMDHAAELASLGVRVVRNYDGRKPSLAVRSVRGPIAFWKVVRGGSFDVVHANAMNSMGFVYAWVGGFCGARMRIVHSHGSRFGEGSATAKTAMHGAIRALFGQCADVRLACSEEAGRYMFGSLPFEVVRNGIDVGRFGFSAEGRDRVRERLGVPNDTVLLGSIGRVAPEKNPLFQVEVYAEYGKLNPNSLLLFVGDDEIMQEVMALAEALGVADRVMHEPATTFPEAYYSALDCFLFPSLHEGLGISAVEAQCAGLPVFANDALPHEMRATDLVHWIALEEGPAVWAKTIYGVDLRRGVREAYSDVVASAGYSARESVRRIAELYGRGAVSRLTQCE